MNISCQVLGSLLVRRSYDFSFKHRFVTNSNLCCPRHKFPVGSSKNTTVIKQLTSRKGQSEGNGFTSNPRRLLRRLGFTVAFSGCCYVGACLWHYEKNKSSAAYNGFFWDQSNSRRQRKFSNIRDELNQIWTGLSKGDQTIYSLIAINGLVFLLWRKFPNSNVLLNYFMNGFHTKNAYASMILSAFSHQRFWHLFLNMYVLSTFGSHTVNRFLGVEQFVGFYMAATVMSSFPSLAAKAAMSVGSLSLGASGAILALLVYSCVKVPDSRLHIIFMPFFTFSAQQAVYGIIAFDAVGLFLPPQYRIFDHAAHLGGSLFGLWYAKYGEDLLWKRFRFKIVKYWIDLRGR